MPMKSIGAASRPDAGPRETGTAGQSGKDDTLPAKTLPPDPQTLGRPMTPDEQVDEASLESMDGSDPPSYMPSHSGGPARDKGTAAGETSEDEKVRRRAYALWDAAGRPKDRDKEFWERAQREVREGRAETG